MSTRNLAVMALAIAGMTAYGEGEFSDYLWLQTSDTGVSGTYGSSFTRANWGENNEVATAGNKYYVPSDKTLYSIYSGSTFAGDVLAVSGKFFLQNQGYTSSKIKKLELQPGGLFDIVQNSYVTGDLVINGTAEKPSTVKFCGYNFSYLNMSVSSPAGSVVDLMCRATLTPENKENCPHYITTGDWTGFNGTARLHGNSFYKVVFPYGKRDIPGTFELLSGATWFTDGMEVDDGTCTFGGLKLKTGSEVRWFYITPQRSQQNTGLYVVYGARNAFEMEQGVKLDFGGNKFTFNVDNIEYPYKKLFHIHNGATYSADLDSAIVTNVDVLGTCGPLPKLKGLVEVNNADGSKDICLGWEPFTYMHGPSQSSGSSVGQVFKAGNDSFWSTGSVPTSDFVGDVLVVSNRSFELSAHATHNYPGMRLTLAKNTLYAQCSQFTLDELNLVGGTSISAYNAGTPTIKANKIRLWPATYPVTISGWNRTVTLDAPLEGSGALKVLTNQNGPMTLKLKGDNSNYTGAITVEGNLTLAGSNLGGAYEGADTWKAVQFADGTKFSVDGSTTSSGDSRGVFMNGNVELAVGSGAQFKFGHPLTLGGTLTKSGTGTLMLGGTLAFSSAGAAPTTTPTVGVNNQISVTDGSMLATASTSLAGANVAFGSAAALAIDLASTDETYAARGTDFTAANLAYDAARLYVVPINASEELAASAPYTRAICTVTAAQAATLQLQTPAKVGVNKITTSSQTNQDGSVTYSMTVHPKAGLTIFFH